MATTSLTKKFVVKDKAAYQRLVKIVTAPSEPKASAQSSSRQTSVLEEGRRLLKKSFSNWQN